MSTKDGRDDERAALVQQHQINSLKRDFSVLEQHSDTLEATSADQAAQLSALDRQMAELYASIGLERPDSQHIAKADEYAPLAVSQEQLTSIHNSLPEIRPSVAPLSFDRSWEEYLNAADAYLKRNNLTLSEQPFVNLLSSSQRIALEKRIQSDFTLKNAACDKLDYALAAACGLIGGLIDIFFVGLPTDSLLTKLSDEMTNGLVEKFASFCGWTGPREGSDPTKSAISFLERNFKVNYDHCHTVGTGGLVENMSPINHHIKSLAHSPDIIGLIFSIISQFTNHAYFFNNGALISVDTETQELVGATFPAKIFAAFCNWIGHLLSDVAGSSGAQGRGAGIPIPFFNLFQFANIGEFGQHKQSLATVAVKVFEQGYDARHGLAMAIPVLVTELLVRLSWALKQRFYHNKAWQECIPNASNPELRRMLLVGHGALCLADGVDAALRSGGDIVQFLLRTNIIGWARFGTLALKELRCWAQAGRLDLELVDKHIESEYKRLLASPALRF